jgi:glutaredoxin
MAPRILFFSQPGCLSCELMKVFLEAKGVPFEERDISKDPEAWRSVTERYGGHETPVVVVVSGASEAVICGFDPARLDRLLAEMPSSDSVIES